MASADAIWSSRKIAKLTHENVVYMYLTGPGSGEGGIALTYFFRYKFNRLGNA